MEGGSRFAIKIEGLDEANNNLMPSEGNRYVFQVAATGGAPHVTGDDQFFMKKQAFMSGSSEVLQLNISDTSGKFKSGGSGKVTVTPTVYPGYWLKTNYTSSPTKSTKSAIVATVTNGRIESVGTGGNFKEASRYLLWADCKGPLVQVTNVGWVDSNTGAELSGIMNDETSAYWSRATYGESKTGENFTDVISTLGVDDATRLNLYTLRSYWSDIEGSGTKAVYFQSADASSPFTDASLNTDLDADNVPTNSKWIQVKTSNTTPGAKTKATLSNIQMVREGSGFSLAIFAVDNVGNKSPVYRWNGITFDFGVPQLTIPSVQEYYDSVPQEFTISATDSNEMNGITVTATKNGTPVESGNSGYTLSVEPAVPRANSADAREKMIESYDADSISTQNAIIRLNGAGASDGVWSFTIVAKDAADRTSEQKTFTTTIDTVAPVATGDLNISNRLYNASTSWYKNETLRVNGQFTEATSGVNEVYYVVKSSDATTAAQNTINAAVTAGDITGLTLAGSGKILLNADGSASPTSYTITPSGFKRGANVLYVQAVDKSGNKSSVSSYTVRIDQIAPSLSSAYFTYDADLYEKATGTIYSDKESDLVVYGTVSDGNSGVDEFTQFYIGSGNNRTNIPATFTYSTVDLTSAQSASASAFKTWLSTNESSFDSYANIADKTSIKTWKAVIAKENLIDGTYKLTAYDVAQNSQPQTFFTMVIDEEDPESAVASPADNTVLNGTVDFRGTTTDNTSVRKLSLYYSYSSDAATIDRNADTLVQLPQTNGSTKDAVLTDADTYNWEFKGLPVTYKENDVIKLLGNNTYTGVAVPVYFKLQAEDIAGNTSVSVHPYSIDPDADRPLITLSNITSDGSTLLKSSEVYGSITDDDGLVKGLWIKESTTVPTTWPTLTNNKGWTKLTVSNGNFTATASSGDGQKSWFIYCIDNADGTFTNANTAADAQLTRPYISFKDVADVDVKEAISFIVDTKAPRIQNIYLSKAATGTDTEVASYAPEAGSAADWSNAANIPFGGNFNVLYARIVVEEDAGMAASGAIELKIGGVAKTLNATNTKLDHEDGTNRYTYTVGPFVLDNAYASGSQAVSIKVTDAAGTSAQMTRNVIVDNIAPTITIGSPTANDYVTTTTEIIGSADDNTGGSGINVIKWMIPTKAEVAAGITADTQRAGESAWTTLDSTATISIPFSSPDTDNENCILYYANSTYTDLEANRVGIWKVPVYFLIEDILGNRRIDTSYTVTVDTDSGKASAFLTYPVNNQVIDGEPKRVGVGGQLEINGYATAANGVQEVLVQFDVNGDGSYTEDDYDILHTWGTAFSANTLRGSTTANANDWGFVADGTSTWQLTVITSNVSYAGHTGAEGEPNPEMRIRAAAFDMNGITRGWNTEAFVAIDRTVPTISSKKVIGYNGSTAEIEYEYSDNMYISGKQGITWYFEANLSDDIKVDSVTFDTIGSNIGINYTASTDFSYPNPSDESHAYIKVPLSTATDGLIYSRMKALDDSGKDQPLDIRINIDTTAPSLYNTSDSTTSSTNSLRLKSKEQNIDETTNYVQNTNRVFTFGDTVEEAGSGLLYLAFYFERTSTANGDRVYNPLYASGNRANVSDATYPLTLDDNLYSWHVTNATRPDTGSITVAGISANDNIRVGGLVKIGGAYRRITAKNGNTVSISPAVSTDFKDVRFVYAQVVDHLRVTEGPTNGDYDVPTNDDHDGMVEKLVVKGSTYTWSASLYSDRIPDGPVNIHVVAIDAAGNLSHGVCTSSIYNNRPRIAKVLLATELNGNGTYDFTAEEAITQTGDSPTASGVEFGEFVYYSTLTNGQASAEYTVENALADTYMLKDGMLLLPEFVGGNGALLATYKITDSAETAVRTATSTGTQATLKTAAELAALTADIAGTAQSISAHISAKGGFELANSALAAYESRKYVAATETTEAYVDTKQKWVGITFWDETEEKTRGKDSQWAFIKFPVIVDTVDDIVPNAGVEPFYWKSAEDNSGIIRILGSASDETKLTKLTFTVSQMQLNEQTAGAETELATFTNGAWEFADDDASSLGSYDAERGTWDNATKAKLALVETKGWSLAIMDGGVTQEGHSLLWELDIDTQKMTTAVGLDCSVTVKAYDSNNNTAASYVMDVVPYITSVTTSLSKARPRHWACS